MNPKIEAVLAVMSFKDRKAVVAGLDEFGLGKDTRELAEIDFYELAELLAKGDKEAVEILQQPSTWGYSINLLAKHIGSI